MGGGGGRGGKGNKKNRMELKREMEQIPAVTAAIEDVMKMQ